MALSCAKPTSISWRSPGSTGGMTTSAPSARWTRSPVGAGGGSWCAWNCIGAGCAPRHAVARAVAMSWSSAPSWATRRAYSRSLEDPLAIVCPVLPGRFHAGAARAMIAPRTSHRGRPIALVSCSDRSKELSMPTRVAINGFGRIGRAVMRIAVERGADLDIVAVNDIIDGGAMGQLLARDSVYGRFPEPVGADEDTLYVGDRTVRALKVLDPAALPWTDLGVDVVIESTGRFRTRAEAAKHLEAGARKVILSAPA